MRPLLLQFSLLLLIGSCGCAHTAMVKTWEPAEVDVAGMKRIAVLDFTGEAGPRVAGTLANKLGSHDFYTVLQGTQISPEIQMAAYSPVDEEGTSQRSSVDKLSALAVDAGIDAIVRGEIVEYRCEDQLVESSGSRTGLRGDPLARPAALALLENRVIERDGKVGMLIEVIDARTGEVRVSRRVAHRYHDRLQGAELEYTSREDVLNNLTQRCVDDMVAMLAPHEGTSEVELAGCELWMRGRREVLLGNKLAESGDWDSAEQRWRDALEVNPRNHAALYNLAIEADHRQMYTEAESLAMQALRLHHRSGYVRGLEAIRAHRAAFEKAEDQRDSQIVSATRNAAGWE